MHYTNIAIIQLARDLELSAGALSAIKQLLNTGIASIINVFEAKFDTMEKRIELLESDVMDPEIEMQRIRESLTHQIQLNSGLQAQVESIDLNRRLAPLIFTCEDFSPRTKDEDVEGMIVLLNERIPELKTYFNVNISRTKISIQIATV